uniref:GSVIVT00016337001, MYB30 n=1 Tax=Arundo donax TaxID=35708 RepID=A0A0A9ESH6_ARUDO
MRSSSGVHGPFFTPTLSQHGGLPMPPPPPLPPLRKIISQWRG